ncbi:MAG: polysaccharide lyase 6 family protein [Verrucomicrobiota bacterium]|nr:polysaccharide lyase 6 family protein [Verrucomicrobiota bacterium]
MLTHLSAHARHRAIGRSLSAGVRMVLGLLGSWQVGWAADHFVATSAEISQAVARARPGDTITLRDGPWTDAEILFEANGTAEQPIVLRAQSAGKVVISGKSRLQISGSHLVVDGLFFHRAYHQSDLIAFRRDARRVARHCRLTNCAVVDCNAPDGSTETRWISLYGEHNRVDHCWVAGKTTRGATLVVWLSETPNENRIDHNYFGPRARLGKNGGETIRVGDSRTSMTNSRTVVENNCFEECNGEAEIVSNKSCENVYRANTFLRCAGALTLRHGDRCIVEGNYFLGQKAPGTGGVRVIGEGHRVFNNYFAELRGTDQRAALSLMNGLPNSPANGYFPVKNAVIAFNTFVNCRQALLIGLTDADADNRVPPSNCTLANNLLAGNATAVELRVAPANFRWEGNLVSGSAPGVSDIAGIRLRDVVLEQDADGLWRPQRSGPVIGAAQGDFPFITEDIEGHPRGLRKDVGCDQVSTGSPLRRTLRRDDAGPAWKPPGAAEPARR